MNKGHKGPQPMTRNASPVRHRETVRLTLVSLLITFFLVGYHFLSTPPIVKAVASPGLVISQIYGHGGNSGATFKCDYVELYNAGASTIDLSTYSIQYAPSGGNFGNANSQTNLSGSIAPGKYYLIQLSCGAGGSGDNLPAPDKIGSNTDIDATGGKLALVNSQTPLSGACPAGGSIVDLVGWGSAPGCSEGTPAAASSDPAQALTRKGGGSVDTDNNSTDFQNQLAAPRSSTASLNAVVFDSSAKGCWFTPIVPSIPPASSFTWQHTIGGGTNRVLIVGVSTSYEVLPIGLPANRVQSVTYNSQPMTRIGQKVNDTDGRVAVELFRLAETEGAATLPSTGTYPVVVTLITSPASPDYAVGGSASFYGVDQTTPNRPAETAQGSSSTPILSVTSASNELVIDTVGTTFAGQTLLVGAGQTQRWNGVEDPACFGGVSSIGAGSTEQGASNTTMDWSISGGTQPWVIVSTSLKPVVPAISPNTAPVAVSPNPAPTTNEDTAVIITLAGTDAEDNNLSFTITDQPDHGTLGAISTPDCAPSNTCTATVTYTPSADYNGPDSFKFKVNDGSFDSTEATVSITVNAVNDAPFFTGGDDQVAFNSSPQTVPGWASGISPGAPNESTQNLHFELTNDNNSLFAVQPAINPSGTLTYQPALGASGTANVTVVLKDDGGTALGGQDTSAPDSFVITVNLTGWTTTAAGNVTEDEGNPARPTYANFTAAANSGSPAGTYLLRYNITALSNLTAPGAVSTRLRVRFRDDGAGSQVTVSIMKASITGGASSLGTLFDSDGFASNTDFQTQEIVMPPITFDFTQNVYWLEVRLIKTNVLDQPGFGSAQLNQQ